MVVNLDTENIPRAHFGLLLFLLPHLHDTDDQNRPNGYINKQIMENILNLQTNQSD